MNERPSDAGRTSALSQWRIIIRLVLALILVLLLAAYLLAGVAGWMPATQKIGLGDVAPTTVVLIIVIFLIQPGLIDRIQLFEIGNVKVQLRGLRSGLDEIRFVLTMIVTDEERKHLEKLDSGRAANYYRREELLAELRRLRAIALIKSKKYLKDIPAGKQFDLSDFVEFNRSRARLSQASKRVSSYALTQRVATSSVTLGSLHPRYVPQSRSRPPKSTQKHRSPDDHPRQNPGASVGAEISGHFCVNVDWQCVHVPGSVIARPCTAAMCRCVSVHAYWLRDFR
jgi:hypothetical protein